MDNESQKDYLGDQIGWAVRQQIPPTPQFYAIDKFIMQHLPRSIARRIALFRWERNLLPEKGDPLEFYNEMVKSLGQQYIDSYSQLRHANTLIINTVGAPIRIHTHAFKENDREISIYWDKQVAWALKINERRPAGEQLLTDNLKEADAILLIQNEFFSLREQLRPRFIKRGLPLPWTPIEKPVQIVRP